MKRKIKIGRPKKEIKGTSRVIINLLTKGKAEEAKELITEQGSTNIEGKVSVCLGDSKNTTVMISRAELEKVGREAIIEKYRILYRITR